MADDSADLVIHGQSRRVAMDIMKLESQTGAGQSKPPARGTSIDGEVHDQEDLNGTEDAILKIDGTGEVGHPQAAQPAEASVADSLGAAGGIW